MPSRLPSTCPLPSPPPPLPTHPHNPVHAVTFPSPAAPPQTAEVENHMTSVQRMLAFTDIETEHFDAAEGAVEPPPGWPATGELRYRDVTAAYRPGGWVGVACYAVLAVQAPVRLQQ